MNLFDAINNDIRESGQGKVLHLTLTAAAPTYYMKASDHNIRAITAEADGTGIIYLPSVSEAIGQFYYICAPTGATAGDISVYTLESGAELTTYGDMDADDDHMILFSDGYTWRVIYDGIA